MRFYPDSKIRFSGLKAPVDEVEIAVWDSWPISRLYGSPNFLPWKPGKHSQTPTLPYDIWPSWRVSRSPNSLPGIQNCSLGVALVELAPISAARDLATVRRPKCSNQLKSLPETMTFNISLHKPSKF
jgi:hypothetical protein